MIQPRNQYSTQRKHQMSSDDTLINDLSAMKFELQTSLQNVEKGIIVDISKMPDRLVRFYGQVEGLESPSKDRFSTQLEELLALLDELSMQITKKYEDLNSQIQILDGSGA
jgi:hypothetical protein